jgi:RNA polymerase sigma-70 factor, ECF subfamily
MSLLVPAMSDDKPVPESAPAGNTSLTMLERMQSHDALAWERFVDLYSPMVFSWLRRAGFRDEDARDLLQDIFLLVSRSIGQFERREEGSFRGWLGTVTANRVREYYRSRKDQPVAAGGSDAHLQLLQVAQQEPGDPSDPGSSNSLLHRGLELIRRDFEERTWQAFWRCAVAGQAAADIARDLGMTAGGVYMARARVLRRLREELDGLLD